MLLAEKNGQSEEAKALLQTLKESERYDDTMWEPIWYQYVHPPTWLDQVASSSDDDSGTASPPAKTNQHNFP
jgi:hypothetical protein